MDAEAPSASPLEVADKINERSEHTVGQACFIGCGACCGLMVIGAMLAMFSCSTGWMAGSLSFLQTERAELTGPHRVGTLRGRLPAAGNRDCGLYAQLHYPIANDAEEFDDQEFLYWRSEVIERLVTTWTPFPACIGELLLGGLPPLDSQGKPLTSPDGGWPVVIFSSGLTGSVDVYQQFCRDVASTGAIVVALEHEDGAGIYSTDCSGNVIEYADPGDTDPVSFRRPQLDTRVGEFSATIEAVSGAISADQPGPSPIEKVLHTGTSDHLILMGHSFGGCSVFYYLKHLADTNSTTSPTGAVFLDMWVGPLTEDDYQAPLREPFVHITSDDWGENPAISRIIDRNPGNALAAAQVRGTAHNWITEGALFLPMFLGTGDYRTVFGGTMQAVKHSKDALLSPELRPTLRETILNLNEEVIVPL